jgi:hypothetical protein
VSRWALGKLLNLCRPELASSTSYAGKPNEAKEATANAVHELRFHRRLFESYSFEVRPHQMWETEREADSYTELADFISVVVHELYAGNARPT